MALVENRKARFEYTIQDTYAAGVVLSGGEVKSLRKGSASLNGSFVRVMNNEAFLVNAQITPYTFADNREYDPKRTRKLLLQRKELDRLKEITSQKGLTLVPLAFELRGRHIKLLVGVGRGKKEFEKRSVLRQRDIERDVRREFKDKIRLK